MSESNQISRLLDELGQIEQELNRHKTEARDQARPTVVFVRALLLIMGTLALANIYFVNEVVQEVAITVRNLNEMYHHFARVSERVSDVDGYVTDIGENVKTVPVIEDQLVAMGDRVESMRRSVKHNTDHLIVTDQQMGVMRNSVRDMAVRFRALNYNVGHMGQDVYQMSRPVQ